MTDRALVVAAVALAVALVILILRRLPRLRSRTIAAPGLDPGVYLFTSAGCGTCSRARRDLTDRRVAFTELTWEADPAVFSRLGIDAVPSVVVVGDGRGRWWRGGVPRQIPGSEGRGG